MFAEPLGDTYRSPAASVILELATAESEEIDELFSSTSAAPTDPPPSNSRGNVALRQI
ncbi:hypothetical protein D3C75_1126320 [compost metagenome]